MSTVYLHYEAVATFGVIASPSVPSVLLPAAKYPSPLVVTAGVDAVQLWNVRKGEVVARYSNADIRKATHISALSASPDGTTIAAGYRDGSIRTWRIELGVGVESLPEVQPTATYSGHRAHVTSLTFAAASSGAGAGAAKGSDTGRLLSGSADGDLILWDLAGEAGVFRLPAHTDAVTAVLLLQHGGRDTIISASKDTFIRVYDVETQSCVQTVAGHRAEVWDMAVDPAHRLLITGSVDEEVRVFRFIENDAEAPREEDASEDVLQPLGSVSRQSAVSRVGTVDCAVIQGETFALVAGVDRHAELFRVRSPKDADKHRARRRKRFEEKAAKRRDMGVEDEAVFEDKVEARDFLVSVRPMQMAAKFRSAVVLSDKYQIGTKNTAALEVRFFMQRADNALEIHKVVASKKAKKRMRAEDELGDGEVGSVDKLVALDRSGHRSDVRAIAMSPDDRTMLSAGSKSVKLWNLAEGKCIRSMVASGFSLCTSFLAVDAAFAAVGSKEGSLEVFEVGTGTCVCKLPAAHAGALWSMTLENHIYDADVLITGGSDKAIKFWNIQDLTDAKKNDVKPTRMLSMPDEVLCVRVVRGNSRPLLLAALMDSTVRAHFLDTLEPAMNFYGHKLPVMSMDVSSDGQILATGSADKTVKLWGVDFGDLRRSLRAHEDTVVSVAFQPGTHYLFSGSRDGTLKYWDADKFEFVTELPGPRGEVWAIATSTDGELLTAACHDRTCRVWRRTDNPLFLLEEQDRRMDEMMDQQLIEDDVKEARKDRTKKIDFVADDGKGEALRAGKLTLDAVKGGERLLKALELYEEDTVRDDDDAPNPELLGMKPRMYILRILEQIRTADLDEVCHVLPLKQAVALLAHLNELLAVESRVSRLSAEILIRIAMQLVRIHQNQIIAGACDRALITQLLERIKTAANDLRRRFGINGAALGYWAAHLAEENNAAFRDARARAHNAGVKRRKRAAAAVSAK